MDRSQKKNLVAVGIFALLATPFVCADLPHHEQVAARFAPLIYHDVASNPRADFLTPVNYDGDWIANNNWDNLDRYELNATVYYDVRETRTEYYITYMFFHPRDYSRVCIALVCHENDSEGTIVVVDKATLKERAVQSLAHNNIDHISNPLPVRLPAGYSDWSGRSNKIAVFIEGGGHGVKSMSGSVNRLSHEISAFKAASGEARGFDPAQDDHFLFYHGGVADSYDGSQSGVFSYELRPVSELWKRRTDEGSGRLFSKIFKYRGARVEIGNIPGSFAGERWGAGRANPPWGWHDSSYPNIRRGDWFIDPAFAFSQKVPGLSLIYTYNPYLEGGL
jgi:hypothetical protein